MPSCRYRITLAQRGFMLPSGSSGKRDLRLDKQSSNLDVLGCCAAR